MTWLEALILGIIQGLTEFLPVSSSGHLEIGKVLLNAGTGEGTLFSIVVHAGTALSIVVVFWQQIRSIVADLFRFKWNEGTRFAFKILLSMVPAGLIGLTMKDWVDSLFTGNLVIVGSFLFVTAALLMLSQYFRIQRTGEDDSAREVTFGDALVIGVGQALAILPGLSRSGTTISTALLLGVRKTEAAHFSFLMVIPVIAGQLLLDVKDYVKAPESVDALTPTVLLVGMVASFIVGLMACKWMIRIVRQGSMTWFAVYCIAAGSLALYFGLNGY